MNALWASRALIATFGSLVLLAVGVSVAGADSYATRDRENDTEGPLDIETATHGHARTASGSRLLTHGLSTYESWENNILDVGDTSISWRFNLDSDGPYERRLHLAVNPDGTLYAEMHAPFARETFRGYGRVWRPDGRSATVSFPKRLLRKGIASYEWVLDVDYTNPQDPDCPGEVSDTYRGCHDSSAGRHQLE